MYIQMARATFHLSTTLISYYIITVVKVKCFQKERFILAGVERVDTRNAAKAVESVKNKLNNLQNAHSGGIINIEKAHETLIKISDEKYAEIRDRSDDIEKISKNTGFDTQTIKNIKAHVFYDEHELSEGQKRFDSDLELAWAWERLISGKDIKPSDIILLNHESYERELMKTKKLPYEEAHRKANEKYNWQEALIKEASDKK